MTPQPVKCICFGIGTAFSCQKQKVYIPGKGSPAKGRLRFIKLISSIVNRSEPTQDLRQYLWWDKELQGGNATDSRDSQLK